MMMNAALYARFSSDKQSETSAEDQLRLCRLRAERDGLTVVAEYRDEAISGSTPVTLRPGSKQLLADATSGEWSILLLEGLDRLSRDSAELEMTIRRLEHRNVRLIGVSDGYDSTQSYRKLMRGIKGVIAQQYLEELAYRTHRGLSGLVTRGNHAGGLSYGYRTLTTDGGHILEVDGDKADIVREIFARYATGDSCQKIAADLNARGIRGPRGTWSVSALYGSPAKGTGILNNELYIGRYIWNRTQWVKNPDTGVRERVERPRSEWHIQDRPDLQIVDNEIWNQVRAKIGKPRKNTGNRAMTLLGGLLTCETCGGAIVAINHRVYGCATHKDRGDAVCDSRLLVRKDITEARIIGTLREELLAPPALSEMHRTVKQMIKAQQPQTQARRLGQLEKDIGKLVEAITVVGISPALSAKIKELETEKRRLESLAPARPIELNDIAARYRALVARLDDSLKTDVKRARAALKEILGTVRVGTDESGPYALMQTAHQRLLLAEGVDWVGSGGRI